MLQVDEIERPTPEADQVLVKVAAASINPLGWHTMRGLPYIVRTVEGIPKPRNTVLGADIAGTVEAVGSNVTAFSPGDEVFGMSKRTLAEYARVHHAGLVPKPANVSFEQAAAVGVAGITALHGLRKGGLRSGLRVLINGASGGVGTFAVQLARSAGADVTGVGSTKNTELVRSLGASRVIDYTTSDFTRTGDRYDLIFDTVGNRSLRELRRVLSSDGTLVLCGAPKGNWARPLLAPLVATVLSKFSKQRLLTFLAARTQEDLLELGSHLENARSCP